MAQNTQSIPGASYWIQISHPIAENCVGPVSKNDDDFATETCETKA